MPPRLRLQLWPLTLLLPVLSATLCACSSPPSYVPAPCPTIPPLAASSHQPPMSPLCSPTCSGALQIELSAWRQKLTGAASPASAAKANTAP